MEPAMSHGLADGSETESLPTSSESKWRRRQEKRQKRLADTRHMLFTKNFSNYRLPVPVTTTDSNIVHLSRYESIDERHRHPPVVVVPDQKSKWAQLRLAACPCHGCTSPLDPNAWLAHYLNVHMPILGVPFVEVSFPIEKKTLHATCNVGSLELDVNTLLGVFGYQRFGLNPLNCQRNTLLPQEYRKFSKHGVLLLFACHTRHSLLWQRKRTDDVVVIWVSTSLKNVSVSVRCVVQISQSTRYYAKTLSARPLPASAVQALPQCRELIKTDCNVIIISYQDLSQLMLLNHGQQLLNVELHIRGEQKI
ncbi:uncharacterized protein LOC6562844 [Drosophila grimshawi]|uniref:GH10639 n=1 Tax=Drosophila grimshawi TaxID=7222 RepID=B4JCT1_DROGR|nr:uncharacterized protein LOC6562844 [Drosophila grimshawi]EDW03170.1 GH10639 [Drosophila grimshawi]